jgi:hypothetical protein
MKLFGDVEPALYAAMKGLAMSSHACTAIRTPIVSEQTRKFSHCAAYEVVSINIAQHNAARILHVVAPLRGSIVLRHRLKLKLGISTIGTHLVLATQRPYIVRFTIVIPAPSNE